MNKWLIFWGMGLFCLCQEHIALALPASPGSGYALDFDGIDDFVSCGHSSRFDVTDQLTLAAWFNPATCSAPYFQMIARKGDSYYLGLYGNKPYCRIYTTAWKEVTSSFVLLPNTWYYLTMTYNRYLGGGITQNLEDFNNVLIRDTVLIPIGTGSDWDTHMREIGNILYEPNDSDPNKKYKAFYSGHSGAYWGNNVYIGYAYSADGNNWTKVGKVISRSAEDPYVVNNNGVYYLYAEDKEDVPFRNIRLYTSDDCITWTDMGDVFDILGGGNPPEWQAKDVSSPLVWIDDNDVWYLMYEGRGPMTGGMIGLAYSTDGINWTRDGNAPVLTGAGPGMWDANQVVPDDIMKINSVYYLIYHGAGLYPPTGFWPGLATSTDLHTWNRCSWNPILRGTDTLMFAHDEHYNMVGELEETYPPKGIYRYLAYIASSPRLYVNGVEYPYITRNYCDNAPNRPDKKDFIIGKSPTGATYCYDGLIDDVSVWNKALDQEEITNSMYGVIDYLDPNLIAYWPFNESSGYIAYDSSANGINGCLGGNCYAQQSATPERVFIGCESVPQCTTFEDLAEMAGNWLREVAACSEGDRDGDGMVNFSDFAMLAGNWFSGECP